MHRTNKRRRRYQTEVRNSCCLRSYIYEAHRPLGKEGEYLTGYCPDCHKGTTSLIQKVTHYYEPLPQAEELFP